jgi:hypothetical protein
MRTDIKDCVRFKGDFKKEFKDEFPGRDLAEFIAEQLREIELVVNSVEYEELWFTVNVVSGSIKYPLMVSRSSMEDDYWEISCPRTLGFFARLCGRSEDTELKNLISALEEILQNEKRITDIKWYSDYSDLTDDYIKKPGLKRLSIVGKYSYKLFLPLCVIGFILAIVGGISNGKESLLLRIGSIMFLLPFIAFVVFLVANFFMTLVYDIRDSHRVRSKKKWLRWFSYIAVIAMLVVPFFLGLSKNPYIEKSMPIIEKFFLAVMALLLFCGVLFGLFCGISSDVQKQNIRKKKILLLVSSIFVLFGITGFFGGVLSSLGVLKWIPQNIEFPLAHIGDIDVNRDGKLFLVSRFYSRIQVYDQKGDFLRGWFFYAPSGKVQMKINDQNEIEVAAFSLGKIYLFNENGKLLKTNRHDNMYSWYPSKDENKHLFNELTGLEYDVEGLVFPRIIQTGPEGKKKIGKNTFYLFPFQGPFQAIVTCMVGMYLLNLADKKKKPKKSCGN